jgi:hypothetical protein
MTAWSDRGLWITGTVVMLFALLSPAGGLAAAGTGDPSPPPATAATGDRPDRCVADAAAFHQVNPALLRAILRVESRMQPATVTTNRNGSIDVGLAGTNSVHFPELMRFGISPVSLLDPCVSTYVAAWHVRRAIERYGNTWQGVAAYHSASANQNYRYRILLHNELVRMGAVTDRLMPVPALPAPSPVAGRDRPASASGSVLAPGPGPATTVTRVSFPK